MIRILIALSVLYFFTSILSPHITQAKCIMKTYTVKGSVVSTKNTPIENASLSVFFDNETQGYTGISSNKGKFEIKWLYDTYKGPGIFGDRCSKTPSTLTVILSAKQHYTRRLSFQVRKIQTANEGDILELPSIVLDLVNVSTLDLLRSNQ